MSVVRIEGVLFCEVCGKAAELHNMEEGWVHKFDRSQLCLPVASTKVPLGDYLVPTKTLRDEFAMAALQGLLSNAQLEEEWKTYAIAAYSTADAMLKERVKNNAT